MVQLFFSLGKVVAWQIQVQVLMYTFRVLGYYKKYHFAILASQKSFFLMNFCFIL